MKGTAKMTLGILGALAAGVTIGLMIAPQKGSETRKSIKKRAENLLSDGKKLMEDVKENSKHLKSVLEEKAGKIKENVS